MLEIPNLRDDSTIALADVDIPDLIPMAGWKDTPIIPSDQPLVNLNELEGKYPLMISAQYYLQGVKGALPEIYLREEAAFKLMRATSLLPPGYRFILFDGYRPLEVQASLFDSFHLQVTAQHPNASAEEIMDMTQVYVSIPSSDPQKPSPHATGGAIDLSISNEKGIPLDMGTEFDSLEILAQTSYFKYRPEGRLYHLNRKLLYSIMSAAGFTNYPEEWWHYDYGDQFWGFLLKRPATYGLIK